MGMKFVVFLIDGHQTPESHDYHVTVTILYKLHSFILSNSIGISACSSYNLRNMQARQFSIVQFYISDRVSLIALIYVYQIAEFVHLRSLVE